MTVVTGNSITLQLALCLKSVILSGASILQFYYYSGSNVRLEGISVLGTYRTDRTSGRARN